MDEIFPGAGDRTLAIALNVALLVGFLVALAAYLHRRSQAQVFRDLWEAEQRARESEERFRTTVYSIGDAVITTDTTGAIREMNRVAERLTAWTEAEARGRPVGDVVHVVDERSRAALPNPVVTVLRQGVVVELTNHTLLVARDGTTVPIADSAAPIRDRAGQLSGVVLVFSDQTASHAARQQLEESEERLRLALRAANQGTYDLDVQTGEAQVSPEYATMLGYDPATFRETNAAWIERLHPDDREPVARAYSDYVAGRLPEYRVEFRQRTADGGWKWTLSLGRILARTPDGQPRRMLGTHTDISEQKAAEERIRRLSQLYATMSQCNQAIVRSSSEAELFPQLCRDAVEYGGMAMAWIGRLDQASGRVVPIASHGDDLGYLDQIIVSVDGDAPHGRGPMGTAIRENRPVWCDDFLSDPATVPWREPALRSGWASAAGLPLRRDGVVVAGLMLYSRVRGAFDTEAQRLLVEMTNDISFALDSFDRAAARRKAELETEAMRRQLEATLRAVPDLMFEVDQEGRFHACHTPRVDQLLVPPDAFIGRKVGDVLPAPAARAVTEAIAEAVRNGRAVGATYHLEMPGGTEWFELSVARKATAPGEPVHLVVLARDVTARQRAEQQRDHLEAQLRQAQKMEAIGQLAGGVAHDFNNLLTIINGRADLVLDEIAEAHPFHEDLTDIRQAGERAASLTRQLLTFSRRQVDVPVVVSVERAAAGLHGMLRRLISEDIRLTVTVAPGTGAVHVPAGQLEQAILNLVVNARDAMPNGGSLAIDARAVDLDAPAAAGIQPSLPAGRYVAISVSDTGIGMDADTSARAFEPFFTTKGLGKGTGLGLSTVYGIVQQCGGAVTVTSAPGRGTRFDIYLPHVAVETAATPRGGRAQTARGTETVLVVDDEQALVTIASRILTLAGYTVLSAKDGNEALAVLASHDGHVDLLLTDVVIPGMSGRELAERVRQAYPRTKVLFSSGYTDDEVLRRGVESSRAHFIAKPYSGAELTAKVRDVLTAPA